MGVDGCDERSEMCEWKWKDADREMRGNEGMWYLDARSVERL
jgi:hypothetical protein